MKGSSSRSFPEIFPGGACEASPLSIADCQLTADGLLTTPTGQRRLSRRCAGVLRALADAQGIALDSDHLLDLFWGAGRGTPNGLAKVVFQLRRAIAGSREVRIESVYGYGYRLGLDRAGSTVSKAQSQALAVCEEATHRLYERRGDSLKSAQSLYESAAQIDPGCLPAYLGYAQVKLQLMVSGWEPSDRAWPAMRQAIGDALEISPDCAEAVAMRGWGECVVEWDFDASARSFDEARQAAPGSFLVHDLQGRAALFRGRARAAADHFRQALDVNPIAVSARGHLTVALRLDGDIAGATAEVRRMNELDPSSAIAVTYTAWHEAACGDPQEACRITNDIEQRRSPNSSVIVAARAFALARAGQHAAARALLHTLSDRSRYAAPHCATACVPWLILGEPDRAIESLQSAANARDIWLGVMLHDPLNSPLHGRPAFETVNRAVFEERPASGSRRATAARRRETQSSRFS